MPIPMTSSIERVSRFFGYGNGGSGSAIQHQFGDGNSLPNMGAIDPEFMGRLARFRDVRMAETSPQGAIRAEMQAEELTAAADVYATTLRAKRKQAAAIVKGATAKLNHDVGINQLNAQLVQAQSRVVKQHARIGFQNSLATAGAQGAVRGYTDEFHNVFDF
jgi:hypothetical protein